MPTSPSPSRSSRTRVCRGECGRELPLTRKHYRRVRSKKTSKVWWVGVCRECERKRCRDYYSEARVHVLAKARPREAAKRQTPEHKAYMREYNKRHRARIRRNARLARRRRMQRLRAPIPTEVALPYLEDLRVRVFAPMAGQRMTSQSPDGYLLGIGLMAQAAGCSDRLLRAVFRGQVKAVNLRVLDALAGHGGFTLRELSDRAAEWATLKGDPWPNGYYGAGPGPLKRRRKTAKVHA